MKMRTWGEEGIVRHLLEQFSETTKDNEVVGIGDDCAVIPQDENRVWLISTDALVQGVHFIKEQIPPFEVGYKTIAVNVSDIAAMGGVPKYIFLTLACPSDLACSWFTELVRGIKMACQKWDIHLLGGDTSRSQGDIFLSCTLIGSAMRSCVKYRHTAKPNDILCLTGCVGDSGAGYRALQEGKAQIAHDLIHAHFHPTPSCEEGAWLAAQEGVHAMIDVSDGLHCDVQRILAASTCGAVIELTKLPLSDDLRRVCAETGWDPIALGLTGGEDYCLLLTVERQAAGVIQEAFNAKFGKRLVAFGEITKQAGRLNYQEEGKSVQMQLAEFQHFR